jgi:hypothetical protein
MHASDVQTFFETVAAEWDTMRLTYYDERSSRRSPTRSPLTTQKPCSTSAPAPDFSPLALPRELTG